jgi:hypothetical protein
MESTEYNCKNDDIITVILTGYATRKSWKDSLKTIQNHKLKES